MPFLFTKKQQIIFNCLTEIILSFHFHKNIHFGHVQYPALSCRKFVYSEILRNRLPKL